MQLYKISGLYCPFPTQMHPEVKIIEEHTLRWVWDFGLITSEEILEKYKQQGFAAMIAYSYPYGELTDLCAWCDMNTLLFLVDDLLDEQEIIKDKQSLLQFERNFLNVLENNQPCTLAADGPILTALYDFWKRMQLRSGETWKQKFIQGIKDMFSASMWPFSLTEHNQLPDLENYVKYRQYFGAANIATDSMEIMGQVALSEDVYNALPVRTLTELARNAVCFANDLFSLGKEVALSNAGEFNLVTILKRKYNLSIEQAISMAATLHDEYVKAFIHLSQTVFIYDTTTNNMLNKYIECLCHFMKGNIVWSTKASNRYPHIYDNDEMKLDEIWPAKDKEQIISDVS